MTQTAVSQHVPTLEDRLGKPLFRSLPRGLVLTDEGKGLDYAIRFGDGAWHGT